jgi:putative FmdB family regulatory protein
VCCPALEQVVNDSGLAPAYNRSVPIYEYVCMECESHFEELVRGDQVVACPDCTATNVRKQFSVFAVHGASSQPSFGGGGGCCGGSCGCGH